MIERKYKERIDLNCPNCGAKTNTDVCPGCGTDGVLYHKTHNISNTLYNKGLAQAKENDLSGAIITLNKSLKFNKRNHLAHNVLGLVYSACGQTGDAIKEWILSVNVKKEDNAAKDYIRAFEKHTGQMEKLNDSIKLYNQALGYIKKKSEDMAIIRLKRAIELNPNFIDALNLSAFCYMITKDHKKALACTEKVLEIDVNNKTALAYARELGQSRARTATQMTERIKTSQTKAMPAVKETASLPRLNIGGNKVYGGASRLRDIAFFAVGTVLSFAVIFIWLVPGAMAGKEKQITQMTDDYAAQVKTFRQTIADQTQDIGDLTSERDALQTQKDALDQEVEKQTRSQMILTAAELLHSEDFEGAAVLIGQCDPGGLPSEIAAIYQTTLAAAYETVERVSYDEGIRLYNRAEYEAAAPFFEKAVTYKNETETYTGNALYYLGRIAEIAEDATAARVYYERVLNDYPDSAQAGNAGYRLDRLVVE